MSWKALLLVIIIIFFGIFIYLKIQVLGNPNSHFNQTTRYSLGKHPLMRTILGLHSVGDARAEYLQSSGPIIIDWSAPEEENIDPGIFTKFSALVGQYTGRQVQVAEGPAVDDGTVNVNNLASYSIESATQSSSGTTLDVFFTEDYTPRPDMEISRTYRESGMVLSLNAHRDFLKNYPQDLDQYLLSSMIHEFGNQIGMQENPDPSADPSCIMNLHAGIDGQPVEFDGRSEPQDFCPAEQQEIQNIKLQLSN